jgi:hypothetical protein
MPTHETPVDRIVASIACLRNARAGLAHVLQSHDQSSLRARIHICDELINRVGEIDRNLRQLLSDTDRARGSEVDQFTGTRRGGNSRTGPQS